MLSFNNLELVLGGKTLFDDVSLTIHHQQKVGLVGANGTGNDSNITRITYMSADINIVVSP